MDQPPICFLSPVSQIQNTESGDDEPGGPCAPCCADRRDPVKQSNGLPGTYISCFRGKFRGGTCGGTGGGWTLFEVYICTVLFSVVLLSFSLQGMSSIGEVWDPQYRSFL